jgi:hypothetical protein
MKKLIVIILLCLFAFPAFATNQYTTDLEDSSSQYWSITDASQTGLDLTSDFTIEYWVKPESLPASGGEVGIVSKWLSTGNQRSFITGLYNNGGTQKITIVLSSNGSGATFKESTYTLSTSAWTHIAWVYTASTGVAILYINGSSQDTITGLPTSVYNGTAAFTISRFSTGQYYDGLIDDIRVWNDVRTPTEISSNYNCGLAGTETNLVGYWKMENNGNDSTSNGNNLTNNNSATFQTASLPFTVDCGGAPPATAEPRKFHLLQEINF